MIESFQIHITCLMFLIANNSILSYLLGHYFWIRDLKLDVTGQRAVFIYLAHASENELLIILDYQMILCIKYINVSMSCYFSAGRKEGH